MCGATPALDAVERVEIAARISITYEIAHVYGPFGHTVSTNFAPEFDHAKFMRDLAVEEPRAKQTFVGHFRGKYTTEPFLPVWMATELLSVGTISMLYKALGPEIKQRIAAGFGVDSRFLASWLHTLTCARNVCAHHKRPWNRQLAVKPRFPSRSRRWPREIPDNGRLYAVLAVLRHMLCVVSPNCQWRDRLFALVDQHAALPLDAMGFPPNWRTLAIWK